MNEVGKSFFLLRGAGLNDRQLVDLRLRVDGDLARYGDIRQLPSRMFSDSPKIRSSTLPSMATQYWQQSQSSSPSWHDAGTWYEYDNDDWYDEDQWYDAEEWKDDTGWNYAPEQDSYTGTGGAGEAF